MIKIEKEKLRELIPYSSFIPQIQRLLKYVYQMECEFEVILTKKEIIIYEKGEKK